VAFNTAGTNFGADQSFQTLPAPEVVTLPATLVTSAQAVLLGSVNPKGSQNSTHFDYGLTTNYGSRTLPTNMGDGANAIVVSNVVAGVLGYTNYHFRMVAVNEGGAFYGADQTFRLDEARSFDITTLAGPGGFSPTLEVPRVSGVDGAGNLYLADEANFTILKITPSGVVTILAGFFGVSGCADGSGSAARFNFPRGVAADRAGNVYVADRGNHTIRKVTPAGLVTTLAGQAGTGTWVDGAGNAARFLHPSGVAVDGEGNVYVADSENLRIRKITANGVVSTLAGSGVRGNADGTGAAAQFGATVFDTEGPQELAVDSAGTVYVADTWNNEIRKVTPAGIVTTLPTQFISYVPGVAVDGAGNLYVPDNKAILKITPNGVASTLAGLAGVVGTNDGAGGAARFSGPFGPSVDAAGNVYVVDGDFSNYTIRKITTNAVVTTLTRPVDQSGSTDQPASAARFATPSGVTVDSGRNTYIADTGKSYDPKDHAQRRGQHVRRAGRQSRKHR